ncbi:MAG TPA: hypothetical protein VN238_03960 [Solirubrobacteraceae bacterium]|nr:hypothetical protein [Solirubrobacteraceae bacterium]
MTEARQALLDAAAVVPHTDADGLAAGAIALRERGEDASAAVLLGRGETPFSADAPLPSGPLAVLDWGVRPIGRDGVLVDHHVPVVGVGADGRLGGMAPHGDPSAAGPRPLVVSSYGEEQEVPTAPLVRRELAPSAPAWLAAVGAVGDLGDAGFSLPECAGFGTKTHVRKLVSLVNAPRRLPDGPVREALGMLVDAPDARAALADPRVDLLSAAKAEWQAELERVVRTPPEMVGSRVALVRFASRAQVHPLVAVRWKGRLKPRVVLAANDGYLRPGVVNFAVRGGEEGEDLRALLQRALPDARGSEFANGHDRATGGSLDEDEFARLLAGLSEL